MRGLQLTKMYKIFFLFICIITLSCNTNSNHTSNLKTITLENNHQTITNENNEQKIENEELLLFLDNLKKALLEKQIDEIANNMINYPLEDEGPLYEMIYGDKVYEEGFTTKDKPIGKEDFIKIFDKLFTKKYILLFQKLDTKNIIENRIFSWWNKEKTTNIDFSFLSENSFQIDISFLEDDVIGGYTIKYIFKKINGKILLYLVRSV
ncbi:hypothetical protein JMN10_09075 [Capnocytophaga genosp. AHN8471]|uniref:Lipoprotein n=1 Tax=Capnocytophaga genosp. AHN8471 TaxID=327574 RepID=A0ABS1YV39_9FLAO|nr:hypothetical protein [Capnocytophaga genosp. AHN8471]MBM0650272.1 hypothetical protein [Capnocytophaga genosp. AHN8471]MBM0662332.1 hypothetical protein [Capnocytophaga genosp. AHN8471]